jgi:integrase
MHRNGKPRSSFKNARKHAQDIIEIWGDRLTLEKLDRDPDDLLDMLREGLNLMHGDPKTEWNRKVTLSAAINYFKDKKRLRFINTLTGYDWPQPKSRREECPTLDEYRTMVATAKTAEFKTWWWLPYLITLGWEHALRMGEFLSWRWEGVTLEPQGDELPWVRTRLLKQNGEEVYREIPLFPAAAQALRDMPSKQKERGLVIPASRSTVDKAVRKLLDASRCEHLIFHDFRRSLDRRYPGLSQRQRMELLGHKTEKANESYRLRLERKQMEDLIRPAYVERGILPPSRQIPDTEFESGEI